MNGKENKEEKKGFLANFWGDTFETKNEENGPKSKISILIDDYWETWSTPKKQLTKLRLLKFIILTPIILPITITIGLPVLILYATIPIAIGAAVLGMMAFLFLGIPYLILAFLISFIFHIYMWPFPL